MNFPEKIILLILFLVGIQSFVWLIKWTTEQQLKTRNIVVDRQNMYLSYLRAQLSVASIYLERIRAIAINAYNHDRLIVLSDLISIIDDIESKIVEASYEVALPHLMDTVDKLEKGLDPEELYERATCAADECGRPLFKKTVLEAFSEITALFLQRGTGEERAEEISKVAQYIALKDPDESTLLYQMGLILKAMASPV